MKNFLRLSTAFIAASSLAISFGAYAFAGSFADVPENSEHYAAVEYLKSKGVINGYPDGTFQPDKNINRAETLKILLLGTGTTLESSQNIAFPDVDASAWFYQYVRRALSHRNGPWNRFQECFAGRQRPRRWRKSVGARWRERSRSSG